MREDGLETAAVVAERLALLVHLHALAVVLDLGVHAVGTLAQRHRQALARLGQHRQHRRHQLGAHAQSPLQLGAATATASGAW